MSNLEKRYYTPTMNEFKIGFEFQSNFWYFSNNGEWTDSKITDENIDVFLSLYEGDAYETEFRAIR